jgi:hypothetical protein
MPIDEDEWNEAKSSEYEPQENLKGSILDFLQNNQPSAYSTKEIAREIGVLPSEESTDSIIDTLVRSYRGYSILNDFHDALEELMDEEMVEKKTIVEEDEYGNEEESDYFRAK